MFLEDPSVLTKDKLKSELLANNVALPTGEHKKDVYVQLYLKNLTVQNRRSGGAPDAFSSDEDLPPPVVTNRSRSGRKATRKTDKPRPDEVDVSELTDEDLKDQLLKYGISVGPIVASTRKLYEKKLQKLLDQGPPEAAPPIVAPLKPDGNQNGNTDSDQYSDKEEEEQVEAEPELEPEPEPVPVVEKRVRSRGKTPVSLRARRLETNRVEQRLTAGDQTPRVDGKDILKEMFPNEVSTPTGISATCRRPIRGAAGRPLTPSDFWLDEKLLRRTERVETTSYEESCSIPRLSAPLSSSSRAAGGTVAPPAGQVCSRRSFPVWVQLVLLSIVAGFLFFVYQAMETNQLNPFGQESASVAQSGSTGESTSK
ncbi:thymopoietin a [Scleropages formosus]|uniref:Thymopoietin b n=1 Tax=Scleropages formosus TaxID=113540 RepID=A0A8C9R1I6_SCLFO|nr:thymopoietin [Scleropages formosus]XP_018602911.2 thymopoietin [Scleropages formosus]XP_018602913.2 thymopoietin [Scleropages formosus]XP_018602914.2 thymopoietin [Scleropages formosus]XP_018602915.2 thymopoietin [Scleropages formosus]XP_018602916.2 thymopoietin [Scleropages formosus]XP_029102700.1 thymopoietin [Scleropages formosus]XP_029102703.1 thymopoietin [Scleropages formosus]